MLIICSAGNMGANIDRRPLYPVSIPADNLVGVAATAPADDGEAITQFSNFGPLSVPVAAPGDGVVSTANDGGYETRSGTSMAAPHVAGVAALMASVAPTLSAQELRGLLLEHSVKPPTPGKPGYVDALGSVQAAMAAADLAARTAIGQPPTVRHPRLPAARKGDPRADRQERRRALRARAPRRQGRLGPERHAHAADADPAQLQGPHAARRGPRPQRPADRLRHRPRRHRVTRAGHDRAQRLVSAPAPRSPRCCATARTRPASSSSAAGPRWASPTPRAGSSTPASSTARSPPTDPAGLVFTPFAGSETLGFVTRGAPPEDLARILRWIAQSATP